MDYELEKITHENYKDLKVGDRVFHKRTRVTSNVTCVNSGGTYSAFKTTSSGNWKYTDTGKWYRVLPRIEPKEIDWV